VCLEVFGPRHTHTQKKKRKDTFVHAYCTAEQGSCRPRLSFTLCAALGRTLLVYKCVCVCLLFTHSMQLSAHRSAVYQVRAMPLDLSRTSDLRRLSGSPVGFSSLPGTTSTPPSEEEKKQARKLKRLKSGDALCVCVCARVCVLFAWRRQSPGAESSLIYTLNMQMLKEQIR